jgi:peptidoglycan/LPS O-acetylase OafA/YrhL
MPTRRRIPWSIEWSAALFVSVAAFLTIVDLSLPPAQPARDWTMYAMLWAVFGSIALAIVKGWNWVRWLFVGYTLLMLATFLMPVFMKVVQTTPAAWDNGVSATLVCAVVLCFLPSSNAYFRASKKTLHTPAPRVG